MRVDLTLQRMKLSFLLLKLGFDQFVRQFRVGAEDSQELISDFTDFIFFYKRIPSILSRFAAFLATEVSKVNCLVIRFEMR